MQFRRSASVLASVRCAALIRRSDPQSLGIEQWTPLTMSTT